MTTLRLEPLGALPVDGALLAAPACVLWRRGGAVHLSVDPEFGAAVVGALAYRGVRAVAVDVRPPDGRPAGPGLVRAIGASCEPVPIGGEEVDVLAVRRIELPVATARLLGRRLGVVPPGPARRARCRALLCAADAALEIRRGAWCTAATLRAARRALRPTLFDRAAAPRAMLAYATEARLTRWIAG